MGQKPKKLTELFEIYAEEFKLKLSHQNEKNKE
jgi:hypothetical protein